jgi:site-specific DNA recombinase
MKYFHYIRKSTDDDEHQILSLESQERENLRRFAGQDGIEILSPKIEESRSAKYPGRPIFNDMVNRIERGEADGIVAWDPDRLARNSVDGGRIVYLLDTGKLKDLKFSTYHFDNSPHGKFMLQIIFANAKLHVDALSNNVKRGNRTKVENGWWPNAAPIGYLNHDKDGPTPIISDPERFLLVKRLLELALTETYSVPQLREIAKSWSLTTRPRKKIGGQPLSISGMYRVLTNPFYAGILEWEDRLHAGKHEPMISFEEHERIKRFLGRDNPPRYRQHRWSYTGLIRCACGLAVTASEVTNRFGTKYAYYHCTRRRGTKFCREPYVRLSALESQFREFVSGLTVSSALHARLFAKVRDEGSDTLARAKQRRLTLDQALGVNDVEQKNLRRLRTREQITEEEFVADRKELETVRLRLQDELARLSSEDTFEPERYFASFSVHALSWWDSGDPDSRRMILETAGLNPTLKAAELSIGAAFPFRRWKNPADFSELCSWQESNLHHTLRRGTSYPLNDKSDAHLVYLFLVK